MECPAELKAEMRIDWNGTLIGWDAEAPQAQGRAIRHVFAAVRLGRLAGIGAAALLVAGCFIGLAGGGDVVALLLAACGLLLANVLGFVALERIGRDGLRWVYTLSLIGLGPVLHANAPLALALALILGCDWLWHREACRRRSEWRMALPVLAVAIAALTLSLLPFSIASLALLAAALLPLIIASSLHRHLSALDRRARHREEARENAIVTLALQRLPDVQLVVDLTGRIENSGAPARFSREMIDQRFPGGALMDRVLIADRPAVLQALSRAIHEGEPTSALGIRLQDMAQDAGVAAAPRYLPHRLDIVPAPGFAGRAVVLVERGEELPQPVMQPTPVPRGGLDPDALARAFHDGVSPFNAGLGYLEMIADPRLAPHDIAVFRHYAREAMAAVREAHRNTSLMARWLRLEQGAPETDIEVDFDDLVQDAARALNITGEAMALELRVAPEAAGLRMRLSPDHARFAIAVHLRGLHLGAGRNSRITLMAKPCEQGLRITAMIEPFPKAGARCDMFQTMLERAAAGLAAARFEPGADGEGAALVLDKVRVATVIETAVTSTRLAS